MKYGRKEQQTLPTQPKIGTCSGGTKPLQVVRGNQHQQKHHVPSHGMGGMGGGAKSPSAGAQKPATQGGQDHTRGRRKGQGY